MESLYIGVYLVRGRVYTWGFIKIEERFKPGGIQIEGRYIHGGYPDKGEVYTQCVSRLREGLQSKGI